MLFELKDKKPSILKIQKLTFAHLLFIHNNNESWLAAFRKIKIFFFRIDCIPSIFQLSVKKERVEGIIGFSTCTWGISNETTWMDLAR